MRQPGVEATAGRARIVVLHDSPEPFMGPLEAHVPRGDLHVCRAYDSLPGMLAELRPEAVLSFKLGPGAFPRQALLACPSVRWIHIGGAGIDHLLPWDPAQVMVTNSAGIHGDIMAQHVLCMALMLNLNIPAYQRQQRAHLWRKFEARTLAGQTLGVVGFGRVGQEVGALAGKAGMRVLGVRQRPAPAPHAEAVVGVDGLKWVAAEADHLVICLPLTPATRHLIGPEVIGALRTHAHLIDVSRGGIVDPAALLQALRDGAIAAASIDVFASEPLPPDSPFWELPNVVVTPHASSDIEGWTGRVARLFTDNLERWRSGQPLRNVVDPARGY